MSDPSAESVADLATDLERLLRLRARQSDPGRIGLGSLGSPPRLGLLFHLGLIKTLRLGPGSSPGPGSILELAQEAAAQGCLGLPVLQSLFDGLRNLEAELEESRAWERGAPFWWAPLPQPTRLALLWQDLRLRGESDAFPGREALSRRLGRTGPAWLALPELIPTDLIRQIHRRLEAAHSAGLLPLEREGVGVEGRLSAARSDSVLYLNGTEDELLSHAPEAAVLIQWCLERLARHLGRILPGGAVFPPQTAMLARYPAPSLGYRAHMDNPGGARASDVRDNGRAYTLVLYLNDPRDPCQGGEIALWEPERPSDRPAAAQLPALGGSAVFFDARTVAHRVLPLSAGPARWALTLWLNTSPRGPLPMPMPKPASRDVFLALPHPPLPADRLLFHELSPGDPVGQFLPRQKVAGRPRVGLVSTVYGAARSIDDFCQHHFALGMDHLILIFDHSREAEEAECAARLRARYGARELTIWSGEKLRDLWADPGHHTRDSNLLRLAEGGASSHAVSARQTLGADHALAAARGDTLGGDPLDWLLHLDVDERFHLEGPGRGGASLHEHFAGAAADGLALLRYINHEMLHPGGSPAEASTPRRYKINPRLAVARLGPAGWEALREHLSMAQEGPRPYFLGYHNGKSAVRVAAARAAAGVHGFYLKKEFKGGQRLLAGPSILHLHSLTAESFRRKYLAKAGSPEALQSPLFEPSPTEEAAGSLIADLRRRGASLAELDQGLEDLFHQRTRFTSRELETLEEAGLLFSPGSTDPVKGFP